MDIYLSDIMPSNNSLRNGTVLKKKIDSACYLIYLNRSLGRLENCMIKDHCIRDIISGEELVKIV